MLVVGEACPEQGQRDITLVDTGLLWSPRELSGYMQRVGLSPNDIKRIVITHHHLDHAGGAAEVKRLTGAELAAHQEDAVFISGEKLYPSPFASRALGLLASPVATRLNPKSVTVDVSLQDGDKIGPFKVVHVPGHTLGSIALLEEDRGFLMVGDALQNWLGRLSPPSRLFTADMALARASIQKMAQLDFQALCFSHFGPIKERARERLQALAAGLARDGRTAYTLTPRS